LLLPIVCRKIGSRLTLTNSYDHHESLVLPDKKTTELNWKIKDSQVEFGVASNNGGGWLAIGTSDAGGMKGAKIFLLNNDKLEERFSQTYQPPKKKDAPATKLILSISIRKQLTNLFRSRLQL
jgi:hypothetical protein